MLSPGAILREKLEEGGIAEVFFQIGAVVEVLGVDFRHRQAVPPEMPGEFQEGDVLLADAVQDANGAVLLVAEPDDLSA